MAAAGRRWREAGARLALVVGSVALLLAVVEGTLRATGFRYVLYPEDVEFGRPDPVMMKRAFVPDDDVFWVTPSYHRRLAALREAPPELVLMGDSCTQFGRWDAALAALVEARGGRLDVANLGVAGWSSRQGLAQMRRDVAPLGPEVVTVWYGWNDHWIGFGVDDATVARIRDVFSSRWSGLRVVQLATKAVVATAARRDPYPNRVALPDFKENLAGIVRGARAAGAVPLLVTAPSNHRRGAEPPELAERWLRDLRDLVPLHQAYVAAVRAVADAEEAPLCDLAATFAALPPGVRDRAFLADGIHFTPEGDRLVAVRLFDCLGDAGLLNRLVD